MTRKALGRAIERIVEAIHYLVLVSTLWFVFGAGPTLADNIIVTVIWVWGGLWYVAAYLGLSYSIISDQGRQVSKTAAERWGPGRNHWIWVHRVCLGAALAILLWADRPTLAALWFLAFLFFRASLNTHFLEDPNFLDDAAISEDQTLFEGLRALAVALFIVAAFFLWIVLSIPIIVVASPLMLILLVGALFQNPAIFKRLTWRAHDFRKAQSKPEGMIYFVYAEPHQRAHFLEKPGVLAPFQKWLVMRDWRTDLAPRRKGSEDTPELQLLRHYKISNLSKDLPFIAIINRNERVITFRCNEAYRARERDATALAALEERIRSAAARAFPN